MAPWFHVYVATCLLALVCFSLSLMGVGGCSNDPGCSWTIKRQHAAANLQGWWQTSVLVLHPPLVILLFPPSMVDNVWWWLAYARCTCGGGSCVVFKYGGSLIWGFSSRYVAINIVWLSLGIVRRFQCTVPSCQHHEVQYPPSTGKKIEETVRVQH